MRAGSWFPGAVLVPAAALAIACDAEVDSLGTVVNDAGVGDAGAGIDAHNRGDVLDAAPAGDFADAAIDAGPPAPPSYTLLSETGLYADIAAGLIADDARLFRPAYALWSDGALKERYLHLPAGSQIDTSDMNYWRFPVGTKVWKTFVVDDTAVETRLIERWGPGPDDFFAAAFVWKADQSDAELAAGGASDVLGTTHDVPAASQCMLCHGSEPGRLLGVSAVQLSHSGPGITLATLADGGRLSAPPPPGTSFPVPGTPVERAALGYLHANCGHCHQGQPASYTACYDLTALQLRVYTEDDGVASTGAYLTSVDQPLQWWTSPSRGNHLGLTMRVDPGSPSKSAVYHRMSVREAGQDPPLDDDQQMPPMFTDEVDDAGVAAVAAWIESLGD